MTPGVPPEADEPSAAARAGAAEPAGADMAGAGESERVALLAHDIRGALAVVVGYADLLEHRDLTANDRERALRGIHGAVRRADALLDALSGRSRTSARRESVDLAGLVRDAAEDARAATGRQVRVIAEDGVSVIADMLDIERALQNLLENAARHAPTGALDIALREEGGLARVEVADRGPGIPLEERDRIFLPGAQLEGASAEGSGLGLAVVVDVAQRLGGAVEVEDRVGGGALVRLSIPLSV